MSWPQFWEKNTWQTQLLKPVGALVCAIARRRLIKFRQTPLENPSTSIIVVVGNVVVGGSGKTPFIQWLAGQLKDNELSFGIVSRGYGGKSKNWPIIVNENSDPIAVGDEPVLLAQELKCPVAVAPKRIEAIQALTQHFGHLDVIISDDGLQHYAMPRDIEIVMLDAQRLLGNELCMPAGPLREPKQRLDEVDYLVFNGGDAAENNNMQLQPVCLRNVCQPENRMALSELKGQQIQALAGIGNPARFFNTLQILGYQLLKGQAFADHKAFTAEDFKAFNSQIPLLMTAKDAVKCSNFALKNWWYLEVKPQCSSELAARIITQIQKVKHNKEKANGS